MQLKNYWLGWLICFGFIIAAQPAAAQEQFSGEVTAIDSAGKQVTIVTTKGETATVQISGDTSCKRVPPGATTMSQAVQISFQDIAVGDRLLAAGAISADRKSVAARQILIVARSEVEQKLARDREEWQRRGITGSVLALDPASKTLKAQVREQTLTLTFTETSRVRRYAADSVTYKASTPVTFEQIKVGDTFRALGNKTQDGAGYNLEEILVGTFRVVPATVSAIEAQTGELKINELGKQETLTVVTTKDTRTRRLSKELASALAGGKSETAPAPGDFQQQVDRMPQVNLSELKTGDMVLVTISATDNKTRAIAIALIAGVEPVLKPLQAQLKANQKTPNYKLGLPEGLSSLGVSLP
jgi:hypothetical protein